MQSCRCRDRWLEAVLRFAARLFALGGLVAAGATPASAIQLQTWVVTANIRSGNTIFAESPDPPAPASPSDGTGFLEANGVDIVPPAPIDAGAGAEFDLLQGTMSCTGGFDASANFPDDTRAWDVGGGSSATTFDDVTVTSATLSPGTPVTVRFVFAAAFSTEVMSSEMFGRTAADVTSTAAGFQGIAPADNRYLEDIENGLFIVNGLFTGAQVEEYTVESSVGATFSFVLAIDADASGFVRVTGSPGNEVNGTSSGWMNLSVAYGGEVVGADAQLQSGLLAGPFPPVSNASGANAQSALLLNPFEVPEPSAAVTGIAALLVLAGLRGRNRRRARCQRRHYPA